MHCYVRLYKILSFGILFTLYRHCGRQLCHLQKSHHGLVWVWLLSQVLILSLPSQAREDPIGKIKSWWLGMVIQILWRHFLLVDWTFLSFMVFIFTTENTKHILFEVKVTEIKTLNLEISRQIASNLFSPARSLHMNSSRYPGWLMWCGLATLSVNKAEGKLPSWSLAGLYSIPLWFNHLCVDTGYHCAAGAGHAGRWLATGLPSSSSFWVDRNVRLLLFQGGRITCTDFFSLSHTTPRGGLGVILPTWSFIFWCFKKLVKGLSTWNHGIFYSSDMIVSMLQA